MKRSKLFSISLTFLAVVLVLICCVACTEKGLDIVVYDYKTQEEINVISSVDNESEFMEINEVINSLGESALDVTAEPTYTVLFKDPKDTYHDIYYNVVFDNSEVYIAYDLERTQNEFFDDMGGYFECNDITADEFRALLLCQ